jgi:ADP-ribose pyrophosphatase YjhB (NUDIX family)
MHPIRKQILYQLSQANSLTYTQLKPKDVEGNLFMYHLKLLINESIIEKNQLGLYELTLDGYILMSKTSRTNFRVRDQPLIFTMCICQNHNGEYLLYKRLRQPFLGLIDFPYGKLHLGEQVLDAALRELNEKTGLSGDLQFLGSVYKIIYKDQKLLTHTLVHIYRATNIKGELLAKGPMWECFWQDICEIDQKQLNPGTRDILKLLENSNVQPFFETFWYDFEEESSST